MKKLFIIDLEKNYQFSEKNCFYLLANRGSIILKNSKKIDFDLNKNKEKINKKKDFVNYLSTIKNKFNKNNFRIEASELEIFNLRNDKYNYIDKILFYSCLKKKKLQTKFNIEIITDQNNCDQFYQSIFGKKIKIRNLLKKKEINKKRSSLALNYFKFILRAFYFLVLIKSSKKNKNLKKDSNLYLSIYPYFFKNKNMDLYDVNVKKNYLNFSLTDETHLNLSPIKYFNHIKELSQFENLISVEKYIKFRELFFSMKKFYFDYIKLKRLFNKKFFFQGIDCSHIIYSHIQISFYNRYKLFLYEESLKKLFENYRPQELHYFLFEYNFGFFLRNKLKKIKKFVGYQHGIFTDNLMWLDLINSKKNIFLPDEIVCNRKKSLKTYKKNFKKILFRQKINNFENKLKIKTSNSSNILVYLGQHDMHDCLYFFSNNKKFKDKKIYFKVHPNNKRNINIYSKNFYFVNKINHLKKFDVYLAPTTTLIYDFLEKKLKFKVLKFNYKIDLWN